MLAKSYYIGGESNNLGTSITTVRMLIRELEKSLHGKEDDFITIMSDKNREYIICDFSQDSISCREYILDRLQYPNEIKFEAIVLRPGYENIFNWQKKRFEDSNIEYNEKDLQILIKNVYNGIQIPTIDEFKKYNFLDTLIIIYDNYKNEILDIIT